MLYWETADQDPSLGDAMLEWAALWKALPKWCSPRRCRRCRAMPAWPPRLAEEIEPCGRAGTGDIAIGGAALAAEAAALT